MSYRNLIRNWTLPALVAFGLFTVPVEASTDCAKLLTELEAKELFTGTAAPQRTIKVITSGKLEDTDGTFDPADPYLDTADPSAPFWLTLPNGRKVVRIYFSGLRYIEADTLDELLYGGIKTLKRIRGFYKDGTEMTGKYHEDSFPWDPELHVLPDGTLIGHGGVMPQPGPGKLPNVREHNQGRTRTWAKVEFIEISPGEFEERWYFQESLFGHTPTFDRWLTKKHFHNYGATFFRWPDGTYERDADGNFIMAFEGVTEERNGMPWNTEIFGVKVDPTLTRVIGHPVRIQSTKRAGRVSHFKASERNRGQNGYLLEGPRPIPVKFNGKWRWLIAMSGSDYVSTKYGINFTISESSDPMGPYQPVVDADGELIDFAKTLRCVLNATWGPGRPSLFYDKLGRMWLALHFISKDQIPDGHVTDGWPLTKEEFSQRHRRAALVPVKIIFERGQPQLVLDTPDAPAILEEKIRACS